MHSMSVVTISALLYHVLLLLLLATCRRTLAVSTCVPLRWHYRTWRRWAWPLTTTPGKQLSPPSCTCGGPSQKQGTHTSSTCFFSADIYPPSPLTPSTLACRCWLQALGAHSPPLPLSFPHACYCCWRQALWSHWVWVDMVRMYI